jgi:hypothetical protein
MRRLLLPAALLGLLAGCKTEHTVKTDNTVEIKPIEMTLNINLNVKVDKALDDFFKDLD